jgi:molybdenum cofactor biosynthesis enzyme MoaA
MKMNEILSVEDRKIISELAHLGLDELRIRGDEPWWAKARAVLADFDAGTYHVSANG